MECGMVSHSKMIHEKSSLHEEIHEVDHHENVVLIDVETGDSVVSIALGAAATGTGETVVVGGLKYSSNMGWKNDPKHLYLVDYKVVEE
ncbi:hypothetical protein Tco_1132095 [Tanacetum coccineum]|uniref:Dirigent protein n=1 Tax=Tanacetum coccineum TaxID=301880 RepID=A0ABQ5JB02_9ASTR